MKRFVFKQFWILGAIVALLTFLFLYGGVRGILNKPLAMRNIGAYAVLSLMFGILGGAFYAVRFRISFWLFTAGTIAGFIAMYRHFLMSSNGWGDLTGLAYLFIWTGIGLAAGLLLEAVWYLVLRSRNKGRI